MEESDSNEASVAHATDQSDAYTPSPEPSSSSSSSDSSVALLGSGGANQHEHDTSAEDDQSDTPMSSPTIPSSPSSSSCSSASDTHLECCLICGGIGQLLMCDTCPFVFHLRCVRLKKVPTGVWSCDICNNKATLDEYRQRREAARKRAAATGTTRQTRSGRTVVDVVEEEPQSRRTLDEEEFGLQCAFCRVRESSVSSGLMAVHPHDPVVQEERFVGPWFEDGRPGSAPIYAHRACAMWSPRVFVRDGQLQNVVAEVARARWLSCAECGKRGASIGCCDPGCPKSFHYQCAKEAQCSMQLPSYLTYCMDHAVARNFASPMGLSPQLIQARLAQAAGEPCNVARKENAAHRAADAYATFLAAQTSARRLKERRFAHLSHLPYDERRRRVKAELRIRSLAEEEAERAEEAEKARKRRRAMMTPEQRANDDNEEAERQRRRKEEEDARAVDEMNGHATSAALSPASTVAAATTAASPASSSSSGWSMVGGLSTQIASLQECVLLPLLYPELFRNLHISAPRGILLVGPPGTGKTLLARALSHACSSAFGGGRPVSFYARKGADVLSRFHGEAELSLRTLFDVARRNAPSVIYFDEIDGLAPARSAKQNQVHASVVTTLLAQMDGLDTPQAASNGGVFVLASTNRVDAIDPALRRPGRFDREVHVGLPRHQQRQEILRVHTAPWPQDSRPDQTDLRDLATATAGFSGADLRALCSEAALRAAHRTIGPALLAEPGDATATAAVLARTPDMRISADDFRAALVRVGASIRRHEHTTGDLASGAPGTADGPMQRLLHGKLREARDVLDLPSTTSARDDATVGQAAATELVPVDDEDDADIASAATFAVPPLVLPPTIHRLLICDDGPAPESRICVDETGSLVQRVWRASTRAHNPSLLAASLVAGLDADRCVVRRLDIPALLVDDAALNLAEACVHAFQSAAQAQGTTVFYLPRFDEWWSQTSVPSLHPLRAALISCLRNLSTHVSSSAACATTTIFLATITCTRASFLQMTDLHPFLRAFFGRARDNVAFHQPTPIAVKGFFELVVGDTATAIGEYIAQFVRGGKMEEVEQEAGNSCAPGAPDADAAAGTNTSSGALESTPATAAAPVGDRSSHIDLVKSVRTSFAAFASSESRAMADTTSALQAASASLTFVDLQRVSHEVDRWRHECTAGFRRTIKRTRDTADMHDEHHVAPMRACLAAMQQHVDGATTLTATPGVSAASMSLPWEPLVHSIVTACHESITRVLTERDAPVVTQHDLTPAPPPSQWAVMASKHAHAAARLRATR